MNCTFRCVSALLAVSFLLSGVSAQEKKYSIKTATNPAPKDVSDAIRKLLGEQSVQLLDSDAAPICEVWFRKEIPADATPAQIKTGVTFREIKQTEILGVLQLHKAITDYRKQKIKPGAYTMRLAFQPTDGKHTADVADFQEFVLVIKAAADTKTALMETKMLHDKSGDTLDLAHPGVFMLWPNAKPAPEPTLVAQPKNHWVLNSKANLIVGGKATGASIGIGITLIGHSPAE